MESTDLTIQPSIQPSSSAFTVSLPISATSHLVNLVQPSLLTPEQTPEPGIPQSSRLLFPAELEMKLMTSILLNHH